MGHTPRENYEGFFLNPYKDKEGVYAIYDSKDNLIYIGETYDFKNRIYQHIMSSHFKDLIHKIVFYEIDRANKKYIEYILIDLCKPIFNIQHQGWAHKHVLIRDYDVSHMSACVRLVRE